MQLKSLNRNFNWKLSSKWHRLVVDSVTGNIQNTISDKVGTDQFYDGRNVILRGIQNEVAKSKF
jgi:hypothetical protein